MFSKVLADRFQMLWRIASKKLSSPFSDQMIAFEFAVKLLDDLGVEFRMKTEHSGDPDQPFQAIPITHSDRSRSVWRGVLRAPLDAFRDLSVACQCQVRREPVPVVNRRDPRTTRSAPMRRVAACVGGAC